jgi:hypothetical protein
MRQKSLSVQGDYDNFAVVILYEVFSEYAETILACLENKLKQYKRIKRIRQGYFAVYENTLIDIS